MGRTIPIKSFHFSEEATENEVLSPTFVSEISFTPPTRVGEKLLTNKMITRDQLQIGLHEQRRTGELLGTALVRLGFLEEKSLTQILAARTGLKRVDIRQTLLDPSLLKRLPRSIAEKCCAIPLRLQDNLLEIAIADPYDLVALDEIRRHFPHEVEIAPCVAAETDIRKSIENHYGLTASLEGILAEIEQGKDSDASSHPVVRLVDTLLKDAVKQNASDIHLEPENNLVRVRYRLDGVLHQVREIHKSHWPALSQRIKLMAGMNIADQRSIQDGRFGKTYNNQSVDFRVALMPTVWGENIVIRVLDKRHALVPLHELGFSSHMIEELTKIMERPQGITLVTGPTGSGKTTTLYSILNRLSTSEVNIATLEEPVEYELNGLRQTAVTEDQGLSFGSGVRAVLRQDPDIIFIGEIRDADTAQMALRAAMTGHQVYATLHCNDVWSAIPRLIDLGLNPKILAGHLSGIISQRLVRKLCPHCKVSTPATPDESRILGHDTTQMPPTLAVPVGCDYCRNTGRRGRTVVAEILRITPELDDLILTDSNRGLLQEEAVREGFISLQKDGVRRVLTEDIALADLRRAVDMTRGLR